MTSKSSVPRRAIVCITLAATTLSITPLFAQEQDQPGLIAEVLKRVALDPTTYVPAGLMYESMSLDWRSSQVFFQNGFAEHNGQFTISGVADDTPVSIAAGNGRITAATLQTLQMSLVNNSASAIVEHFLVRNHPDRRKLVRTLGWIERTAFASYWSYRLTADHWRQWQTNERLARQYGYK